MYAAVTRAEAYRRYRIFYETVFLLFLGAKHHHRESRERPSRPSFHSGFGVIFNRC